MVDRLKMPPEKDFKFYQRRKHDKWREVPVPSPALEVSVADSHAHVHMLPDPAWELARCAANGVDHLCMMLDPSEDGSRPFDELDRWLRDAQGFLAEWGAVGPACAAGSLKAPEVRIAVGVHPHNAKRYDEAIERELRRRLDDPRVGALGEIGLDFYYDLSPRDVQRRVFRRQLALAKEAGLPVALHLRSAAPDQQASEPGGGAAHEAAAASPGKAPDRQPASGNAHAEALAILREEGFPEAGTLLHCCSLPPDELRPWIEAGCYIAYGGALTFKNADAAREGARLVPAERLLLETDAPYMTPEPMRGAACTPAHVIFTAAVLAETRGMNPGPDREAFLRQLHENTLDFFR